MEISIGKTSLSIGMFFIWGKKAIMLSLLYTKIYVEILISKDISVNKVYIHTKKCRVESDYIKDLKYLAKA